MIYIGIMIIYTKLQFIICIFLGGTSNNIILDLHAEGKASHITDNIEGRIEQLAGDTAAIKTAQPRVKQNTYIVSIRKKSQ